MNYDKIFVMFQAPVAIFSAVAALLISATPVSAQRAVVHENGMVKAIVDQFDKSDLVGLGELHGSQADQDLRFQIMHSKAFAKKVHIIVVEGLNSLYQEDLDRYIRGEDVPLAQVQKVWRDSTGIFVGPVIVTIDQQFLSEVRSVNRGLPDRLKLRVIAVDPALDWAKVQSAADFRSVLGTRSEFGTEVIERETLRKGQKALLVFATAWFARNKQHMTVNGMAPWTDTIGARLDRDFPGRLKTRNGARIGDLFMSLFHTCELNGADPFDYLNQLQRHAEKLKQTPSEWMPWNYRETPARTGSLLDAA
jgi:hypothetical protein